MAYQIIGDEGVALDAHFSVEPDAVIYHSRGGSKADAVNSDYGPGLRLILSRIKQSDLDLTGAWVDSSTVQQLPKSERSLLRGQELLLPPNEQFRLMSSRMKKVGQRGGAISGGNATKRLRIALANVPGNATVVAALGGRSVKRNFTSLDRLPHEALRRVTDEHIWDAVEYLRNGGAHGFGESIDYDVLLEDGTRLAPKAVFGVAASNALGFQVRPRHFFAGLGTPAFEAIMRADYQIVRKGEKGRNSPPRADAEWREGSPALRKHLRRERAAGLSKAKKAEFVRIHGRLYCEKCKLDPVKRFGGDHGEAAIEVHHAATHVADMEAGHVTTLADLQCLCANCHRVEHRLIKLQKASAT